MTSNQNPPGATRRAAFGIAAATLGAGLAGQAAAETCGKPRPHAPARYDDPIWNREQAARIESHTDGRQVFGRATGTVNGVRPGEAVRHLFNFEVFSTIRVVRRPDGNYDRMCKELIFYTDPATGKPMDQWTSPYTGETVRVVDVANDPYNWVIRDYESPPALPGAETHDIPEPKVKVPLKMDWTNFGPETVVLMRGGHGWYPNLLDPAHWPRESGGAMVQATELFRYFIKREDLEDPTLTHLPHNGTWQRITPWLPWMLMGQTVGHIHYDGMFRSSDDTKYHPVAVLERVRERYPSYMEAPKTWYGPSLSSIEHYAREQKPAPVK